MTYSNPSPSQMKTKPVQAEPQTCPMCGRVECFERPQFFSGQLLTDKDLDAAQQYVIEKNRLHNRYLVGTGVVCGLAVRCDPCDRGSVIIEPGYAIDCCGNDLVVCKPHPFNVLDHLQTLQQAEAQYCEEYFNPPSLCEDQPKEYCLMLSYDEKPAKPVTALIRNNGCSTTRCQHSRILESFHLNLIVKEKQVNRKRPDLIPTQSFLGQVRECFKIYARLQEVLGSATEIETRLSARQEVELTKLFCEIKNLALELYKEEPQIRCSLPKTIREISEEFQAANEVPDRYNALVRMLLLAVQFLYDCICNALLVPCTTCDEDEGVLLACLTLRGNKIEKICNLERTQLITGPALRYWMQPLFTSIDTLLEQLCCNLELSRFGVQPNRE